MNKGCIVKEAIVFRMLTSFVAEVGKCLTVKATDCCTGELCSIPAFVTEFHWDAG